jgi:hypothetical protein
MGDARTGDFAPDRDLSMNWKAGGVRRLLNSGFARRVEDFSVMHR